MLLFVLVVAMAVQGNTEISKDDSSIGDSYLNAYAELHNGDLQTIDKRKSSYPKGVDSGYPDYQNYPYPPPQAPDGYGPPQFHQPEHAPPHPYYGPPYPAYGQPHYPPNHYEPSSLINGIPYALLGLYDKFKFKLSLITIFKILLKLVLFKKFVSFAAIIFLLLFIPWLKGKKSMHHHHGGGGDLGGIENDEEDDIMRQFSTKSRQNQMNSTASAIMDSIENFKKKNNL